jgi:hypothetical protein
MKTHRQLWLVVVIAAWLAGCAESKDSADNELGDSAPRAPADSSKGESFGNVATGDPSASAHAPSPSSGTPDFGESTPEPGLGAMSSSGAAGASGGAVPAGEPSADDDSAVPASEPGASNNNVQAGTLTAGAWDDNLNFDRFSEQRSALLQSDVPGALPTTDKEHADAHEKWSGDRDGHQLLDISLVIDTTGSMGDEINYLQTELDSIAQTIEDRYPNAEQRWSLIVYRDAGDEYVTRAFDFTSDLAALRANLQAQSAGGGGDFPEAPDAALAAMDELDWRSGDDAARLVFWIADAPHHAENAEAMADAIRSASALDVHVYPVASSGIDDFTELTMRSAAQLTGGRYLFLTDDSGVGGEHKEPNLPCYFVTRLDQALLRMVDIELSGEYREPAKEEIIRTGGDPSDGACELESGDEVEVF